MSSGKKKKAAVVFAATIVVSGLCVGSAAAGAKPAAKTTGSVTLAGNTPKYLSYDAFQTSPVKGSVSYTDFDYSTNVAGSGVWAPEGFNMGFGVTPDPTIVATYAQSITSWTPTSATSIAFTGDGATTGWLSNFQGTISGSAFSLSMTEINAVDSNETYALTATGTVASNGSVTGTWSDNYGSGRTGNFVIDDVGHEVLHYVAPVAHVAVAGQDANFDYVIPNAPSSGDLAGVPVYIHVHDGGSSGAGNDTLDLSTTPTPLYPYTITSGNLTVFS